LLRAGPTHLLHRPFPQLLDVAPLHQPHVRLQPLDLLEHAVVLVEPPFPGALGDGGAGVAGQRSRLQTGRAHERHLEFRVGGQLPPQWALDDAYAIPEHGRRVSGISWAPRSTRIYIGNGSLWVGGGEREEGFVVRRVTRSKRFDRLRWTRTAPNFFFFSFFFLFFSVAALFGVALSANPVC